MKFGMSMLLWTPTVTEAHVPLFADLARWGYDGVEIPVNDLAPDHYAMLGKALDQAGLGRVAVGFATPDASPCSPDAAVRAAAGERIAMQVERAAALGADLMGGPIHSGYADFTGAGPREDELQRSAEVLHAAAERAQGRGVRLGVEFLNRFECYLVTTAEETQALVRRADHGNLCTVYDTHHAHIEERDQAEAIAACADTLGHVQLSESHRGVPGQGQVDWGKALRAFHRAGYEGWFVVESFSRLDPAFGGALHIWRDFAPTAEAVCVDGLGFLQAQWQAVVAG